MSRRFFSTEPIAGDRLTLSGPEAHHLLHVVRLSVGETLVLFDGSGAEFPARVLQTARTEVTCEILGRDEVDRELPFPLTLAVALPKGDRQRWLVEKLVELGVTRLVPLRTDRRVAQPKANALDRLRRSVVEASKQCGRNRLMEITEPADFAQWVVKDNQHAARWLAHPGIDAMPVVERITTAPAGLRAIAIGPEGGWTDEEVAMAVQAGWQPVDLGPRILRIETAAILLAALATAHG